MCTATNETPHDRMFQYHQRNMPVKSLPVWIKNGDCIHETTFTTTKILITSSASTNDRYRVLTNIDISKYEKFEDEDCVLENKNGTFYHNTYSDEFFDNRQEKDYERQSERKQSTPKQPAEDHLITNQVHRPIRHRSPPKYLKGFKWKGRMS
ncbi:hypothetical protein GJ496_002165 [Pomphorhynchus laevis]|nr:hypothetical protein GJ496_002165 [Pomphorhynchus laevis]